MQADKQTPLSGQAIEEAPWEDFPQSPTGASGPQQNPTKHLTEELRQAGAETARKAKQQGEAYLGEHKNTVAQTMHHCGDALRDAARNLQDRQDPNLASFTDIIADRIERTSGYLESKRIEDIQNDVEQFARRQPFAFYGGMFVAGVALSRFFKASQVRARENPEKDFETRDYEGEKERSEPAEAYGNAPLDPI